MSDKLHSDTPLYLIGAMRSPSTELSESDMAFLGAWHRAASEISRAPSRTVQSLYVALTGHDTFRKVGRVCLAKLVRGTHKLEVVSSINGRGVEGNPMGPGYSCFVRPDSSLLTLQEGQLRVYSEAARVNESFSQQGEPPQRSIRLVAQMGLRSGLCLPINVGQERGFLFLNSAEKGLFDRLPTAAYLVLALCASLVKTLLVLHGDTDSNLPDGPEFAQAEVIAAPDLEQLVNDAWRRSGCIEPEARIALEFEEPALVCLPHLAEATAAVLAVTDAPPHLELSLARNGNSLELNIPRPVFCSEEDWRIQAVRRVVKRYGFVATFEQSATKLRCQFEPATSGIVYSV